MDLLMTQIEKLLVNHDFVIIPGLGGLVVQQQSAVIEEGIIHSPRSQVGFNPKMNQQDGLLTLAVSRALKINFKEAEIKVRNLVYGMRKDLNNGHQLHLGKLGTLHQSDHRFIFEPSKENYILPANISLSSYKLRTAEKTARVLEFHTPAWVKYAAAVVIFISLFFTSGTLNRHQSVQTADFSRLPLVTLQELVITPQKTPVVEKIDLSTKPYHVVVAAFHSRKVADNYCSKRTKKEFADAFVIGGNKFNKIVAGSFDNYTEALNFLQELKSANVRFNDAWILRN